MIDWRRVRWYCYHTLHPRFLTEKSIVLDLGANRGHFSLELSKATGAQCIAVEPSPEMFPRIPTNERIRKVQAAITDRDGEVDFSVSPHSLASAVASPMSPPGSQRVRVPSTSIESLVATLRLPSVDAIKMDIEGMEIAAIDACSDSFLRQVGQLTIEFHDFCGLTPAAEVRRIVTRLRAIGFHYVRMSGKGNQDAWFINSSICQIAAVEVAYIRLLVRNAVGMHRFLKRSFFTPGT